ncbi:MAG: hypothetical protein PHC34_05185 [Candidatus Gastranaerophilales bacterium]|nr:hypothetical protein [Candidatus Gastranaerophilales bacterium]
MSMDPSKPITNQVKAAYHTNSNGGGLGGGSARSFKSKFKKKTEDKFSLSEELENEINQELMNKSLITLFKESILYMYNYVLVFLGIKKEIPEENEETKIPQ